MIFPGQAQVGVQVYSIYVCLSAVRDGKKRIGGGDERAERRHFFVSFVIHQMAVVCVLDSESLSLKTDPWLVFTGPVTYASDVRAFCCQYVCMTAGSLKAPRGTKGAHRAGEKTRVGVRISSWQLTHSSLETYFSMVARGKYLVSLPKTKRCESQISVLPKPFPF